MSENCYKKNMLLKEKEKKYRVLAVEKEKVLVIDCIKKTMPVWKKKEDLQSSEIFEEDVLEDDLEDLEKEARKMAYQRYGMILEYSEELREVYNDKQKNTLKSAIQYLENAFPEKNKNIRKISIPMLIYLADVAEYDEVKPRFFRDWWNYFTEEDAFFEVYKTFCSSGSTKLEKIKGRLAIMTKLFCKYFELDYPEELVDMIAEVEEKLAAKEEKAEGVVLEDGVTPSEEKMEDTPILECVDQDTEKIEITETVEENTEEVIDTEDSVEGAVNPEETVSEEENIIDEVSLEESDAHTDDGANADTPSYEEENPNDEGSF